MDSEQQVAPAHEDQHSVDQHPVDQHPERSVDAIVIGLGPGGEDLAARLARGGWRVAAVESHLVGGECPYYGCIPSKMMLHESRRDEPDWERVATRIRQDATDHWDDRVAVERLTDAGVTFLRGQATVDGGPSGPGAPSTSGGRGGQGHHAVTITPDGGGTPQRWTASRAVVLNTGSVPSLAPIPGLPEREAWTHRDVVTAQTLPASLAIVGGGPLACELAQALAGFGVRITLVVRGGRLLSGEVPQAGDLLAERFRAEGIDVRTGTEITGVTTSDITRYESSHGLPTPSGPVDVTLSTGESLSVDHVLLATGRMPRDEVRVDEWCRILDGGGQPVPGRYALGDMTGAGPFTHTSVAQSAVVAGQLLGGQHDGTEPKPFPRDSVPRVTYTDPEVAAVGLSERAARDGGGEVRVARVDLASSSRGWIDEVAGHLTLVARDGGVGAGGSGVGGSGIGGSEVGQVLVGASVVGPQAGEIVGALTVAVHARVRVAELMRIPWAYPTLHRAIGDALGQLGQDS
ncbi:dihydrolipoyl dehydrogenase family protein [Microbacterium sp. A93]|uniref:dihydrolipoyl dehydrogenase family protein n=1 Tax=Microbacterium sp. A93 TaxID=3450716 RepID=UPI003F438BCF